MTVETAAFLSQLDATLPASGDAKSEGDNHLRLIKAAVKGTFPNIGAVAVTANAAELNYVTGVTSGLQAQLGTKAPLASPALTGVPVAPTAAADTSTTQVATTAFATSSTQAEAALRLAADTLETDTRIAVDALKAPLASPTFTGSVTIPAGASIAGFAPLASPALTGTPTAPTAAATTSTTQIATTAMVQGALTAYAGTNLGLPTFTGVDANKSLRLNGTASGYAWVNAAAAAETLTNKTITGLIDHTTGAAIASAATVNLDTATGNRVHITGTTTITAVTLTRGPRTVIFDGILTLTHHATNNNLPGAANITTAAGDRAIYESDGTKVYCVSYIKVSGAAVVTPAAGVSTLKAIAYALAF